MSVQRIYADCACQGKAMDKEAAAPKSKLGTVNRSICYSERSKESIPFSLPEPSLQVLDGMKSFVRPPRVKYDRVRFCSADFRQARDGCGSESGADGLDFRLAKGLR
ncbi:hypothetical protein IJT93_01290 [bacterium]|nr:hypothetical protein [bacterium]